MEHHNFTSTVRKMARDGWGRQYQSDEDAKRDLSKEGIGIAEAVLLELLRRLDLVLKTLLDDREQIGSSASAAAPLPVNAGVFPGCKVGDFLYHCGDLDEEIQQSVVTFVDGEGHARVIATGDDGSSRWSLECQWATNFQFRTEAEALRQEAQNDVTYHEPRLDRARQVLAAIEAGEDLARFRDGLPIPEDDL